MIRLSKTNILLLLMLLVLPVTMRAQESFYIEALNIVPGDTKTLCLSLDNSSQYKGFQTDLILPEGLSIAVKTDGTFDISLTDRASSSFLLSSNEISEKTIRMVCFSSKNETLSGNSGRLVKVKIKASADFTGGYIQLHNTIFSDTGNRDVKMGDSKVQVLSQEQNSLAITGGELAVGKGQSFLLSLNNDVAFTAYQLDVVLPTGLTLDLSKCGMTERCSSSHKLTTKDLGNGKYRIICMAMDNATLSGNQGAILNLWIQSENGTNGKKRININNVVFSDAKAKSYPLDAVSFQLNIKYVPVTSISISETSASLNVGDTHQLQATVLPDNCSDKTLVWESSNSAVATTDNNGSVTAIAGGQCVVTAYSADRSVKATCSITVEKIALTAKVQDATRIYGDENPELKVSYSGFKEGDSEAGFSVLPTIVTKADVSSNIGTYVITASGAVSDKYEITYVVGTLTVTKAALTISAGSYTKKQGDAMPEFTASCSGFKNNETEDVLTKKPVFATDATVASDPGEYAVTVSGAESENYEISYVPGILRILDSKQTITWDKEIEPKTNTSYTMNATASSGLPVTYSYIRPMSAWQTPIINGNEVTFMTEGRYLIIATQSGNEKYDGVSDTLEICALESDEGLMYIDGIYYKYADSEHTTLKVVRGYKTYSGGVVIPETANGLPIVEIENQALYACYFLNSVIVGDNVMNFGEQCLGANPNLANVTLPYKATTLPEYLFNCDDKLAEIHCRANNPYDANEMIFNGFVDYTTCILFVPHGSKEVYSAHGLWGRFANIVEEDVVTGIELLKDSTEKIATGWYTINGMKLSEKPHYSGVYIHDGKKVYVK